MVNAHMSSSGGPRRVGAAPLLELLPSPATDRTGAAGEILACTDSSRASAWWPCIKRKLPLLAGIVAAGGGAGRATRRRDA